MIEEICGSIPVDLIKKCPVKNDFFKKSKLNCSKERNKIDLDELVNKKSSINNLVLSLIKKCLIINPLKRPTIKELLDFYISEVRV